MKTKNVSGDNLMQEIELQLSVNTGNNLAAAAPRLLVECEHLYHQGCPRLLQLALLSVWCMWETLLLDPETRSAY